MDKKVYDYWLYGLYGIGKKTFIKLYEEGYVGSYLYKCSKDKLPLFLSETQQTSILEGQKRSEEQLKTAYEKLKTEGIFMTVFGDDDYPKKLYEIPDKPAVLFYKGKLPKDEMRTIAMIGARNCSEYGRYVAGTFATFFAENEVTVISGMANGIDGIAQKAALKAEGFSVGVLGSGVNICYPMENFGLYKELIQKGCVLSEYLPYERATSNLFPPRNRIISGLADALLVIEAKEKSGTLITVEMALEQGKDVYVVPGRITDELSKGCNRLLSEGAILALSPKKVLENLYHLDTVPERSKSGRNHSPLQKQILSFLEITPVHINVLQDRTGLPMEVLNVELLYLTMEGDILQLGSDWYQKKEIQL